MYKQLIIARKDLNMSSGKLSVQVSHASMAFLTRMIINNINPQIRPLQRLFSGTGDYETYPITIDKNLYEQWIADSFTKVLCQAKNKYQLLKAAEMAKNLGMVEGKDYFLIKDNCLTELTPEEIDENGIGRTLTCIGFVPMANEVIEQISKKYQLWRD